MKGSLNVLFTIGAVETAPIQFITGLTHDALYVPQSVRLWYKNAQFYEEFHLTEPFTPKIA